MCLSECNVGSKFVYKKPGEPLTESQLTKKAELGDAKVMAVAVLTGRGPLPLIFVPSKAKINSNIYCKTVLHPLTEKLLPKLYAEGLHSLFVHRDAAPSHTSRITQEFMDQLSLKTGI